MSTCKLDEADLDAEDQAILAEVAKKGYYHGRPKSEACPNPEKIDSQDKTEHSRPDRTEFDAYQKKWERFGNEAYITSLEREIGAPSKVDKQLSSIETQLPAISSSSGKASSVNESKAKHGDLRAGGLRSVGQSIAGRSASKTFGPNLGANEKSADLTMRPRSSLGDNSTSKSCASLFGASEKSADLSVRPSSSAKASAANGFRHGSIASVGGTVANVSKTLISEGSTVVANKMPELGAPKPPL